MAAFAAIAFVIGAIVGAGHHGSAAASLAERFAQQWARGEYRRMYGEADAEARGQFSAEQFQAAIVHDRTTATAISMTVLGHARSVPGDGEEVPVLVRTRLFGELHLPLRMTIVSEAGSPRVQWSRSLAFPGMSSGELLSRRSTVPQRATLLTRDNTVLAEGPAADAPGETASEVTRPSPLGAAAAGVLGSVGPAPAEERSALEAKGFPAEAFVGLSGVERALDEDLRGTPGGELLAGANVLARVRPHAAAPVRTSVSPILQQAATEDLGEHYGAVVAMEPTGQILAVAGIGLDGLQPPGSTFKMVTVTAALASKVATPHTVFPYSTYADLDGVKLSNANGEECGGTLELAFAVSCNSVFAPLAVKIGAPKLVETAESLGFNHPPGIAGAAESTLPPASRIQGELDLGSTAIGQAEVLATPLQMATVAATIADEGVRPTPTFLLHPATPAGRSVDPGIARTVRRLMIDVVREGTGRSAAIPGVTVAGKTGTAELKSACTTAKPPETPTTEEAEKPKEQCAGGETESSNTDAWFAAFAPAEHPRIVVCVMLVKDGAGGETAAPVAREVIETALQHGL